MNTTADSRVSPH